MVIRIRKGANKCSFGLAPKCLFYTISYERLCAINSMGADQTQIVYIEYKWMYQRNSYDMIYDWINYSVTSSVSIDRCSVIVLHFVCIHLKMIDSMKRMERYYIAAFMMMEKSIQLITYFVHICLFFSSLLILKCRKATVSIIFSSNLFTHKHKVTISPVSDWCICCSVHK